MDEFEWNVVHEGQLLDAMHGHKPVGINKYFQMAFICDKFTDNINKDIHPQKVWAHLETMYNLEALDESESIPFPNSEKEFALPESDFGPLMVKKEDEKKNNVQIVPTPIPPVAIASTIVSTITTTTPTTNTTKGRETPKNDKTTKEKEKNVPTEETNNKEKEKEKPSAVKNNIKEATQRRDSKDSKDSSKSGGSIKKEVKKEQEKPKGKGRNSSVNNKEDNRTNAKNKNNDDTPKIGKRPTRNSKLEDSSSSGKSSPINLTPTNSKRRRVL